MLKACKSTYDESAHIEFVYGNGDDVDTFFIYEDRISIHLKNGLMVTLDNMEGQIIRVTERKSGQLLDTKQGALGLINLEGEK